MNSDALAYLAAKGLTLEEVIEFARLAERKKDATNAVRQARHRAKRADAKVTRYSNGVTPPIDRTHTPSDISPNGENQNKPRSGKQTHFVKPDWADPEPWDDFLKNRKRKKLPDSATAYAGFLADIESIADAEWPPGRLLNHAAAKGWGSINDPRESLNGRHPAKPSVSPAANGGRGPNPNPLVDLWIANREPEYPEVDHAGDHRAWSTLPAIRSG